MIQKARDDVTEVVEDAKRGTVPVWFLVAVLLGPGGIAGVVGGLTTRGAIGEASGNVDVALTNVVAAIQAKNRALDRNDRDQTETLNQLSQKIDENQAQFAAFASHCRAERAEYEENLRSSAKDMTDLRTQVQMLTEQVREHRVETHGLRVRRRK